MNSAARSSKMKITLIAFFATFFIVTGNALTVPELGFNVYNEYTVGYIESIGFNKPGLFAGVIDALKIALRTLKGLNCTIKEVIEIRAACFKFLAAVENCGTEITGKAQEVVEAVVSIILTCDELIHMNSTICGNGDPVENDDEVDNVSTSITCSWTVLNKMMSLVKTIETTTNMIKDLALIPNDANVCFSVASRDLLVAFITFPDNIVQCSKLTK